MLYLLSICAGKYKVNPFLIIQHRYAKIKRDVSNYFKKIKRYIFLFWAAFQLFERVDAALKCA